MKLRKDDPIYCKKKINRNKYGLTRQASCMTSVGLSKIKE